MIASYTWGQDAARLASYLSTPAATEDLVTLTLQNLALLHNVTYDFLREQYVDSYAYSWYNNEYSVGAFPEFAPGQFAGLMPVLMTPSAGGRMHFGGDALSAGHAWIVGALNSAYRCVREILVVEGRNDLVGELERLWGPLVSNIFVTASRDEIEKLQIDFSPAASASQNASSTAQGSGWAFSTGGNSSTAKRRRRRVSRR